NRLYAVDANMQEKLVLDSPKELIWVTVTPDGKHIVTETREEETPRKNETKNEGKSRERVKISIVDSNSWAVQTVIQARGAVNLEATSSGVAEVSRVGAGVWLVRFGPDHTNIARVRARRPPRIFYGSSNTLLLGRCSMTGDGYGISAFTMTGRRLWGQHWNGCRYTATLSSSEDGSRFALGTTTFRVG